MTPPRRHPSVTPEGPAPEGRRDVSGDVSVPAPGPLREIHDRLLEAYGPQNWWPVSDTSAEPNARQVEIVAGAILTQNTAWRNVERAIARLIEAKLMSWRGLRAVDEAALAEVIRPAGTYRVKARRLKAFVGVLFDQWDGDFAAMTGGPLHDARQRLLAIPGIGPETADAILVYAAGRASFVVDAYTRRLLRRHGVIANAASYDEMQAGFHAELPTDAALFNEYHALLVEVGKRHCRATAQCDGCPLQAMPHDPTA